MADIAAQIPDPDHEAFVTDEVTGFNQSIVATIERFPTVNIQSILGQNKSSMRSSLEDIKIREFYDLFNTAGELFSQEEIGPNGDSPSEYKERVSCATGLPISSVRNSVDIITHCLENIESILRYHTPDGDISVFDNRYYQRNVSKTSSAITVGYTPEGRNLGVIAPSNHPAVMTLALVAYATKYPLAIRPSDGEPFTPARLVAALHEAGVPKSSLVFLPGDQELGDKVLSQSDLGIGFGGPVLQQRYSDVDSIKIHGPGNSKVVIDEGWETEEAVYDLLEEAMMRDGGRGCINMSQIVTTGDASIIAERLAERVADISVRSPLDAAAEIPAFVDNEQAGELNRGIDRGLQQSEARDVTAECRDSGRLVVRNGVTYLRPTVVEIPTNKRGDNFDLLFREYPFQYATVLSVSRDQLKSVVSNSLSVSIFSSDSKLVDDLLFEPTIEKVYADGGATCDMDLREPHEGYLTDFLFTKKAYRK